MNTFRHFGSRIERIETCDAARDGQNVARIMAGIKNSLGVLDPADVSKIQEILSKYGGGGTTTTAVGISSSTDAIDAGRRSAAEARRGVEVLQAINERNREFWEKKNAALRDSIRR